MSKNSNTYWKTNLKYLAILLGIWFTVSFLFGIILAEYLNQFMIGGFPLGFWFAQQGSILVFIVIVFYYAHAMSKLDREFDLEEE